MTDTEHYELAEYRIEKAKQTLNMATIALNADLLLDAVNRSYY